MSIPIKPPRFQEILPYDAFLNSGSSSSHAALARLFLHLISNAFYPTHHLEPRFSASPSRLSYKQAPPCLFHCNLDHRWHVRKHCSQTNVFWLHKHTTFIDLLDLIPLPILYLHHLEFSFIFSHCDSSLTMLQSLPF